MMALPEKGEFCYVDLTGIGTREGRVISAGKDYEVRLVNEERTVTVPNSCVWTALPTEEV